MSEIARKSVETFAARIAAQAFAVGGAIVMARALGASGKGVFVYAATLLAMLQMANGGQSSAIAWQYTRMHRAPAALLNAMRRVLAVFIAPVIAGLIVAAFFVPGQHALFAVAAAVPFALFVQSSTGFFLADGNIRAMNWQQILISVVSVIVYVPLLLIAHAGLPVLFAVWAGAFMLSALYSAVQLRRYASMHQGEPSQRIVREQVGYGAQVSLNSAMQYLNFRIDVFLIMFMLGQSALGVYSIGIGLGEMLWQLSRPMVTASFARIARGNEPEAAAATATCMRHSFALVVIAAIIVFFIAPPLIPLVYGSQFAKAGIVVRVLLPGIIAYSMMPTLSTFFAQQLGQPRLPLVFSSLSTLLCAGITILTLPHLGIIGGALATSISYCVAFSAAAVYFVKRTRIAPLRLFALTRSDLEPYRSLMRVKGLRWGHRV
jgi:O-antigen/teichoic acid export membrane protein